MWPQDMESIRIFSKGHYLHIKALWTEKAIILEGCYNQDSENADSELEIQAGGCRGNTVNQIH